MQGGEPTAKAEAVALAEEDVLRAQLYDLLAGLLSRPPGPDDLSHLARLEGNDTPLGNAIGALARAAGQSEVAVRDEYHTLFIGVGRGELLPYASYYLTGFLNEKPLAKLRSDMAGLGVTRGADTSEPEDHAASVLEIMAGLIDGRFGEPATIEQQ
ncbi:MAG: TorD/DmsD family molecular chaperone, partial [Hyphomicrobiaceae bacterium]